METPDLDEALGPIGAGIRASLAAAGRRSPGLCVLTGGQTGVDTIAAVGALGAGLITHVVFPRGFGQEDGPLTDARRRELSGAAIHELASATFAERTWSCVRLADAVILIDPAGGEGCEETLRAARSLGRPILDLGPRADPGPSQSEIAGWLRETGARVIEIAGCRASLLDRESRWRAGDQIRVVISGIVAGTGDPANKVH